MLVFGHSGIPVIFFPPINGRYFHAKDNNLIGSVSFFVDNGLVKIYCPDCIDNFSWRNYTIPPAERVKLNLAYENTILYDVLEFAKHETEKEKVVLAGSGFGGYHAANMAFKMPDKVSNLFCLSGEYDIKPYIYGYYDDDCYFSNPPDYLPNLEDNWYLQNIKTMGIILGTGSEDIRLGENIRLSNILSIKGISHWLDKREGFGHDWFWWNQLFPQYLSMIKE